MTPRRAVRSVELIPFRTGWQVLPKGPAADKERGRTPNLISNESAPNHSARTSWPNRQRSDPTIVLLAVKTARTGPTNHSQVDSTSSSLLYILKDSLFLSSHTKKPFPFLEFSPTPSSPP
ncbi:hypothetical protein NC652_035954 [Populus alba x Populus x berolinensis]|nr:hypothetical protein NC652_035954 [Populus alba x Populus x berolinensis]